MFKWLLTQKLNLSSSLTIFKSEFKDGEQGNYVPSAWDNRFILNMSGTYNFPKHWSLGAKVSCIGGSPYTPYDVENLRWWKLGMCRDVLTMIIAAIIRSVCRFSDNWMYG